MSPSATAPEPFDLLGVGLGPFNLSLAALADGVPGVRAVFLEQQDAFHWHPGLLLDGTTLQVPFLADLVTLIDPTSRWSFLSYLREHDRLFRFYFYERFHLPRREYDDYCRWVAQSLGSTRFGTRVDAVRWRPGSELFEVTVSGPDESAPRVLTARNLVLGLGTEPVVPPAFAGVRGRRVFHSADFRGQRDQLAGARHVTVVGSGQSGAEVFAELLRAQPSTGQSLAWITRTPAFAPMEYSKLGLEQFTPDYVRYFHGLDQPTKDATVPGQWQLYKGIDAQTIGEIYDLLYERSIGGTDADALLLPNVSVEAVSQPGADHAHALRLRCRHRAQHREFTVDTDAVVLATGYAPRRPTLLDPVGGLLHLDPGGRFRVDDRYRLATAAEVTGRIYVQNAELHTHGVGAPDLGLGAWRAAVILDDLTDGRAHRLPPPTAFTTFGAPEPPRAAVPDGATGGAVPAQPVQPAEATEAGGAGR
ncbi:lysine N6-hydroxylase [Parafrankia irregularis]|uniref:L-lysine N6-monooxygenase MbtG n=1 Tax=Parafrankia irregularis TaxID=795642 RepID=A0A0S4QUT8_9ACTN|nr:MULTISPECIES: SidA/IucD/PvdA family monooxygenase [Parafrankia]MBE3204929.1 SidA/IucD/PvdA family monooxygenase [Parafrankia sp. CH37]CUU58600.1 lysine N6-hydroxylase [Parafrankia irregularis]